MSKWRQVLEEEDLRYLALLRLLRFQYVHIQFFFIYLTGNAKNGYANKIQGSVAICFVFLPSMGKIILIQEALMHIILINWLDCTLSTVCDLHVSVSIKQVYSVTNQ